MNLSAKLIGALCALGIASVANAHLVTYQAFLSGPAESPANASPGIGYATAVLDEDIGTMQLDVTFSGLIGNTTASHIHGPTATAFTGTAGVMTTTPTFPGFPSGVTSGSYSKLIDLTVSGSYNPSYVSSTLNGGSLGNAYNNFLLAMDTGKAYINIHTSVFPGGEIRGFFVAIPEPTSLSLLAPATLALTRRTRRA
jgi:hypothetical protein